MDSTTEQLEKIAPSERILLLPHCLRRTGSCKAEYNEWGLQCRRCNPECPVNRLTSAAAFLGYKGICVAPGGRLAVKYVKTVRPAAVVAVACEKELEEGIQSVEALDEEALNILIEVIPLTKDGCIDTEVDQARALEVINRGCEKKYAGEGVPEA